MTMTTKQYLSALRKLGLTPAGKATATALGLSLRQCQRIAAGAKIPKPVYLLLSMYLKHGFISSHSSKASLVRPDQNVDG